MKTRHIFLYLMTVGLFSSSCDKQLDLAPEDTIIEDKVFEKFSTAESAVAGTYHLLFSAVTKDYIMAEATASTCEYSAAAARTYDEINNGTVLPENSMLQGVYESYYATLNQANLLIFKIDELGQYDEDEMNQHIAEAKFLRAYSYHRLLGWYGDGALMEQTQKDGVVLYLEHYDGFDRNKDIRPRNTNEEVFEQIIKDLTEAKVNLPEPADQDETERRVSRANKAIVDALLSRVYMQKRDYAKAAEWSEKALAYSEYALEDDVLSVFPPNPNDAVIPFSTEHIFGIPVSSNGGNWQFGGNNIYYNYNNYWYSDDLIASFSASDERRSKLMREASNEGNPIFVTNKYPNNSGRDNVTLIRLPEVLLTRAEALTHTGNAVTQEMVDLLNDIHLRANPTGTAYMVGDFASTDELRETILTERSKELAFEGLSRFDMLRTDRSLYNADLPDNKKVLPIPLREVEISNGVVKQNEGYVSN